MAEYARKPLVKLTGMYQNTAKNSGETYFSGFLGNSKIMLFRDKNAEEGKPGWNLCVQEKDPPKPDQAQGGGYGGQNKDYQTAHSNSQHPNQPNGYGGDAPF
ncbi:MAG: hypothetical protein HQL93_09705 [Magnetococcales bacterium]|nr:hypothetical protein [Magnetococcales bacterium]